MKVYQKLDVYQAAQERFNYVFKHFEKVYVSFSGGKDSGVMLNMAIEAARKANRLPLDVLFIDLEAQYQFTIDYVKRELSRPEIKAHWVCLPLNLRNAVSVFEPFWTPWDPENQEKWVRALPDFDCITEDNCPFPFWKRHMEFEEFVIRFGEWFSQAKQTACLVGIRSDESLNRFRTINSKKKQSYRKKHWTTLISMKLYNAYPLYDWVTEDIWTANAKQAWDYNKLYDMFYMAGVSIHEQRICQPYGDDQRIGLNLFRTIEPQTWHKVVNRVSGANFGNIYAGNSIMGYRNVKLPKGHTWKTYTKLLLATLPEELRRHYTEKFVKFMRYWHRNGSPVPDGVPLPKEAVKTGKMTTRGNKDKETAVYRRIPDALDGDYEAKRIAPSWRRMAICILKNDHLCKGLSFSQTKEQQNRIATMLEKYRNL